MIQLYNEKTLYILCGPAGSGKSTWVHKNAAIGSSAIISRDRIRFAMVKEDEPYFSKENDVYLAFQQMVAKAIVQPWIEEVYVDATHLTEKARREILTFVLPCDNIRIVPVVVKPSLEKCLEQNAQREGRARVPDTVIKNMYNSMTDPAKDKREYDNIIYVTESGEWE